MNTGLLLTGTDHDRVMIMVYFSRTGHHKIEGSKNKKHPRCTQVGCFIWLTKLYLNHSIWLVLTGFGDCFVKQKFRLMAIDLFWLVFNKPKYFQKRKKNGKKEKESLSRCRSWQKCKAVPANFQKMLIEKSLKMDKNRNTRLGLAVLGRGGYDRETG